MNNKIISKITLSLMMCFLMCSFLLTGCKDKSSKEKDAVETVFAVYALKVNNSNLDDYLAFGGNVQAASSVDIYPDVQSGKITRILVKVGEVVQKNQVLAEVDSSRPGMDYKVSPIKAPVSGTVTSLPINVGSTVAASMAIGKISSTGKLEIKTNVAERFISRIGLYQKAELTFDAFPGESFPAVLVEIDPVLDTSSRTLGIKLIQEPSDPRLRAGMYARIKLVTDTKKNAIVIPHNVIVTRNSKDIVYVLNPIDSTVSVREVQKGIRVDDKQEVVSGLNAGDIIIVKGQALLSEGAKVNVISISE
ncbi:MAG: efflux RND transporter periplasmic adaptor subunit [Treponemataceae bacterium]|nr:efflux RND transporter periplasmic adaptor subunit [Spirochaetales bacterium]MDY6030607.1 efflux RND transporter periplasmic adaptor subunit [Treponemataceae bacterium]